MIIDYFLVYWYPVGFWYTNQGLGAPDQAVTLILSKGLSKTPWSCPRVLSNVWWYSSLSGQIWFVGICMPCHWAYYGIPESILGSCHLPQQMQQWGVNVRKKKKLLGKDNFRQEKHGAHMMKCKCYLERGDNKPFSLVKIWCNSPNI